MVNTDNPQLKNGNSEIDVTNLNIPSTTTHYKLPLFLQQHDVNDALVLLDELLYQIEQKQGETPTTILYDGLGVNTDGAMTQKAVTDSLFALGDTRRVKIGSNTAAGTSAVAIGDSAKASGQNSLALGKSAQADAGTSNNMAIGPLTTASARSTAVGPSAKSSAESAISLGTSANATGKGSVALGSYSGGTGLVQGVIHAGTSNTDCGYDNTNFRLLTGLHDGQGANDAVTVGQVNTLIDNLNTTLGTSISHIGV